LNYIFKGRIQIPKKHLKKYSPSLTIKEMQIKIILTFHLTSVRTPPTTNVGEDMGKKESSYITGGNVSKYNHFGKQYGGSLKN
jgi:hypothetical protein